jgi:hypothetical protein
MTAAMRVASAMSCRAAGRPAADPGARRQRRVPRHRARRFRAEADGTGGAALSPATGTLQWAGFHDEGEGWPDASRPPLWRVTVTASADGLDIVSRWDGAAPAPAAGLRIVLPLAETRKVRLNGVDAAPVRQTVMGVERLLF